MIALDIRTSYFFAFVSHGLLAVIVASFWRAGRTERGLIWWIADGLVLSLASLLLLAWGTLPPWLVLVGSNFLIFCSMPIIESGLRAFFRDGARSALAMRWLVAALLFVAWMLAWRGGWTYAQRVVGFSAAFLIQLCLFLAYLLSLRGPGIRLAQGLLLFGMVLIGAAVIARMGHALRHIDTVTSVQEDWFLPVLTFAAVFAAFLRTCCALLLMHRRAEQRLRAAHQDIERRANYDQQTGVMSRSYFEMQAHAALIAHATSRRPMALLLLDIDHFKAVNDTFGHLEGDEVLGKVGHVLRHSAQDHDLVGRLGGDEFAMLLRDVSGAEAIEVAERILSQAASILMPDGRRTSFSIGVCSLPPAQDFATAYRFADAALYAAKLAGRGRVVAHDPFNLSRSLANDANQNSESGAVVG